MVESTPAGAATPPRAGLPVPLVDADWSPPRRVAGDVDALHEAIRESAPLQLRPGQRRFGPSSAVALLEALRRAVPGVALEMGPPWHWSEIAESEALPLSRLSSSPPRYATGSFRIEPSAAVEGEAAALLVDEAPLPEREWLALPAATVGSCVPALTQLAIGQEQSLVHLEPFFEDADQSLRRLYQQMLRGMDLPLPKDEDCRRAWQRWLDAHERCVAREAGCEHAPRLLARHHASIAMQLPAFTGSESCTAWYEAYGRPALVERGRRAAAAAGESLDAGWMLWVDRLAAMADVFAVMEDLCEPRRRRYSPADLQLLRVTLTEISRSLRATLPGRPSGSWRAPDVPETASARGNIDELLRFSETPAGVADEVRTRSRHLLTLATDRASCRAPSDELPLAVLVAAPGEPQPRFLGYFFPEELSCSEAGL